MQTLHRWQPKVLLRSLPPQHHQPTPQQLLQLVPPSLMTKTKRKRFVFDGVSPTRRFRWWLTNSLAVLAGGPWNEYDTTVHQLLWRSFFLGSRIQVHCRHKVLAAETARSRSLWCRRVSFPWLTETGSQSLVVNRSCLDKTSNKKVTLHLVIISQFHGSC